MGGVAGDQLQAVLQGDRRDDGIGHADRLADAFQIPRDPARQFGGGFCSKGRTSSLARAFKNFCMRLVLCTLWQPLTISIFVTTETVSTPWAYR